MKYTYWKGGEGGGRIGRHLSHNRVSIKWVIRRECPRFVFRHVVPNSNGSLFHTKSLYESGFFGKFLEKERERCFSGSVVVTAFTLEGRRGGLGKKRCGGRRNGLDVCGREEEEEAENLIPTFKKSHFSTASSPFAAITYTHTSCGLMRAPTRQFRWAGMQKVISCTQYYTAKRDPPMEPWPVEDERGREVMTRLK